jgi:hypothetical protein
MLERIFGEGLDYNGLLGCEEAPVNVCLSGGAPSFVRNCRQYL